MTNYSGTELPWTGGGPWRILDDCPAKAHVSLNIARGRRYTRRAGKYVIEKVAKCICPGAGVMIERDNAMRRARQAAERASKPSQRTSIPVQRKRVGAWVPQGVRMPDLSRGLCRSDFGRAIHDKVLSANGGAGHLAVQQARDLCTFCPVLELCMEYVLKAEVPGGSWTGVWAGMSQKERRVLARRGEGNK